jgi:O-antigen/teichoic acid export membrane protein
MAAGGVSSVLTMLGAVIVARALGPTILGEVVLALAVTGSVAKFLDLSFEEALVHHGQLAITAGDAPGLRTLFRVSLMLDAAVGVVIGGALILLAGPLAEVASSNGIDPALVRLAAVGWLVGTVDGTTSAVLLVAGRPHLRAWVQAGAGLFRLLGIVVAVGLGGGAVAILVSYAATAAAGSLLLGWVAWRVAWREWAQAPRGPLPVSASRLLRFGFHTSATVSVNAVGNTVFPILLGNLAGTSAVGIYRVATLPINAAQWFSGPVRLMILPEQARLFAHGKLSELRQAMTGYSVILFAIALPIAVVSWILMPEIIELLFSSAFEEAVPAARILLIAAVVQFSLSWSKSFHGAVGRPHIRTRLSLVYVALNLSLLLLLADRGAEGAALAVTISGLTTSAVWVFVAYRYLTREESAVREEFPSEEQVAVEDQLEADQTPAAALELPTAAGSR